MKNDNDETLQTGVKVLVSLWYCTVEFTACQAQLPRLARFSPFGLQPVGIRMSCLGWSSCSTVCNEAALIKS